MFVAYIDQFLAPTRARGDIVIMDNLPAHKVEGAKRAIARRGAILVYLPPYSPDLDPIEQLFAKLKARLRKAAERSKDALWARIRIILDEFRSDECPRCLAQAGYN